MGTVLAVDLLLPSPAATYRALGELTDATPEVRDHLERLASSMPPPAVAIDAGPGVGGVLAATALASDALEEAASRLGVPPLEALTDLRVVSPQADRWTVEEIDGGILRPCALAPRVVNVMVVAYADRMSPPAADRLLRTVESPPAPTWFVLVVEQITALPATLRGRLADQVILTPTQHQAVAHALIDLGMSATDANRLAALTIPLAELARALAGDDPDGALALASALDLDCGVDDRPARLEALATRLASLTGLEAPAAAREILRQVLRVARPSLIAALRSGSNELYQGARHRLALLDESQALLTRSVPPKAITAALASRWPATC